MGLLGAILLVPLMAISTESQVVFPSNFLTKVSENCTASNGQSGFCFEFRTRAFRECSFFPSQDTSNPNVADHLRANICRNTGKEVYFCCPSKTSPPVRQPISKGICSTTRCQANAQCVEGSLGKPTKCNCNHGYRSYQDRCIATCNAKDCQANALCVEGSGTTASVCLCKKGYRSDNGKCLPTCRVKDCPANALCVEGSGAAASVCMCKKGYRSNNGKCLSTCKTTNCPKNAQCLEGSGSTGTSCKCKNGYKSTRTECIALRSKNTLPQLQRLNLNQPSTQGFSGSSSIQNQGNSWDQFRRPSSIPNQGNSWNQFRPTTRYPYQYQWHG